MTTFEMAQKAFENPGKVFVGKHSDGQALSVFYASGGIYNHGVRISLEVYQAQGWQWEEEKQPRKVEFEVEWLYDTDGTIARMPGCYPWEELRNQAGGSTAIANTRWRVKVTAEEVL